MANSRRNRRNRRNTRRNRRQNGGSEAMPAEGAAGFKNMMGGGKIPAVGTKAQVYHGTAKHTSGGLTKKDLVKNKHGGIVSRRKQKAGRKAIKTLRKLGYIARKGSFKLFSKKAKRGGSVSSEAFSEAAAGVNDLLKQLKL